MVIEGYGTSKLSLFEPLSATLFTLLLRHIYLVMYGAAVIWHGMCGHGQLPRVPLGVTHVIIGCFMGMRSGAGLM